MEKSHLSLSAAVFLRPDGSLFFVEYQTTLDLEKIIRDHEYGGSKLIGIGSIPEAQETINPTVIPNENYQFRR